MTRQSKAAPWQSAAPSSGRSCRGGAALRHALRAAAFGLLALAAACTSHPEDDLDGFDRPETALDYEAELSGAPTDAIDALMRDSLATFRRQDDGAQSLAFLRRRAQGDIDTAQTILRSRGYYKGEVTVSVAEASVAEDGSETPAKALIAIDAGPQFTLARHDFVVLETGDTPPPPLDPAALGSPVGASAEAAPITQAEQQAVVALTNQGRPYARFVGRDAVADLEANTIEVTSTISAGPYYLFGPVSFEGNPSVESEYLATYVPWEPGAPYEAEKVREYQKELTQTSLFRAVSVSPPEDPPEGETAPIGVTVEEGPFRSVAASLRFSTDNGPEGRASFEHRNLFGANEQLRLELNAGIDEQRANLGYLVPQYGRPGQDLVGGLELRRIEDDKFEELGATLTLGLQRKLNERWTVGAGGLLEYSQITDDGEDNSAQLAGLPMFVSYDGSDDALNPTKGQRARLAATPFVGTYRDAFTGFLVLDGRASAYQDLLGDGRYVLAERARLGSILSGDLDDVPPTRRFYSGGGGSVRGFEQDLIGPLDDRNDPIGGRSVAEIGIEMRARIWGDIGGVVFVDGGTVSEETVIDFSEDFLVAAGTGLRYYSPVGPVRVDIAFPLNGRDVDDTFQFYFSIGQAF